MRTKLVCLAILFAMAVSSCGGENPGLAGARDGNTGETPTTEAPTALQSFELLASSPQLQSDDTTKVTLSAIAKDENNQVVEGVSVLFSASAGSLFVMEATTNEQGIATAELGTGGDPTNRTITATASAGGLDDAVDISVIGSTLNIQGPSSLVSGDTGTYTITLANSSGAGISDRTVTVSSSNGNSLSSTTLSTDNNGRVTVTMTGDQAGNDTLRATALPDSDGAPTVSAETTVSVSADSFRYTTPANGTEINLAPAAGTATVNWEKNGTPQTGATIRFATTRGTLNGIGSAVDVTTNADGNASVTISSTTAGNAVITATNSDSTSIQRSVEFVATNPDTVSLQADPGVVAINESSTLSAVVRDANNNLVKNATVEFTLTDSTGGSLSTASAITDSQGRAQTVYTAGSTTSADNGVSVTANVVGGANPSATTTLTVSGRALFINFGTGNTIVENETDTHYIKDYVVMVTDSSGKGVANQKVTISALPDVYRKGYFGENADGDIVMFIEASCANEDANLNGVLDAGEDQNLARYPEDHPSAGGNSDGVLAIGEDTDGDGTLDTPHEDWNFNGSLDEDPGWQVLEPGNRALITPGTVTTDENGLAEFELIYPQDHAGWFDLIITAKASVAGTESKRSQRVYLSIAASDEQNPPNWLSPFGTDYMWQSNCTNNISGTRNY